VQTPEPISQAERRKDALSWLDLAGFEPKLSRMNSMPVERLEQLAEVVRSWERDG
jgi:hypothetical protein